MSIKEVKRCKILSMAEGKQLTQSEGANPNSVTERHYHRIVRKYRENRAKV